MSAPTVAADTGVRFTVADADAEHATLRPAASTVGELLRWGGVPPMFSSTIRTATISTSSRRCHDCPIRTHIVRLLPDIAPARLGLG